MYYSTNRFQPVGSRLLEPSTPALRGTDVRALQLMLADYAELQDRELPVAVNGIYDDPTVIAVRRLQQNLGLPATGKVGPDTWLVLGCPVATLNAWPPDIGYRQLEPGDQGGDVQLLQNRLNAAGFWRQLRRPADGYYDEHTLEAVRAFQISRQAFDSNLPVDGRAGRSTLHALICTTRIGGRDLRPGDCGLDLMALSRLVGAPPLCCLNQELLSTLSSRVPPANWGPRLGAAFFHALGRVVEPVLPSES